MADILSHARASCSAAVLAAGGVFGSNNSGLQKVFLSFVFFFQTETLQEPCRNQLIKDAECHCGVIGIGNY